MLANLKVFFQKGLWQIDVDTIPKWKAVLVSSLRILIKAGKGFQDDQCMLRASALTFYSLLSFVPVLAMAFGIAKGFGMEGVLETELRKSLSSQPEAMEYLIEFSNSMLEGTKGGFIAGIGVVLLIWSVMKVLGHIETAFNSIWNITKNRPFVRKITEYIAVMLFGPVFIIFSSSATVFITSQVRHMSQSFDVHDYVGPFMFFMIKLTPYVSVWLLFTLLYMIMPNTKVKFKNALIAGIVGGTIFQFSEWGYINFQVGAVKYNTVYGSFAALPLFLVWLQISWLIVLFGAELSYFIQTYDKHGVLNEAKKISTSLRRRLSLLIMKSILSNFKEEGDLLSVKEIKSNLKLPGNIVQEIIDDMKEAKMLSSIKENKVIKYQPRIDPELLTVDYILKSLDDLGHDDQIKINSGDYNKIEITLAEFDNYKNGRQHNLMLKEL